jgi:CoA-transferase family III
MAATSKRMLDGYKVLDFTQVLAGPTTTRYLAEMGAQVGDRGYGAPIVLPPPPPKPPGGSSSGPKLCPSGPCASHIEGPCVTHCHALHVRLTASGTERLREMNKAGCCPACIVAGCVRPNRAAAANAKPAILASLPKEVSRWNSNIRIGVNAAASAQPGLVVTEPKSSLTAPAEWSKGPCHCVGLNSRSKSGSTISNAASRKSQRGGVANGSSSNAKTQRIASRCRHVQLRLPDRVSHEARPSTALVLRSAVLLKRPSGYRRAVWERAMPSLTLRNRRRCSPLSSAVDGKR